MFSPEASLRIEAARAPWHPLLVPTVGRRDKGCSGKENTAGAVEIHAWARRDSQQLETAGFPREETATFKLVLANAPGDQHMDGGMSLLAHFKLLPVKTFLFKTYFLTLTVSVLQKLSAWMDRATALSWQVITCSSKKS